MVDVEYLSQLLQAKITLAVILFIYYHLFSKKEKEKEKKLNYTLFPINELRIERDMRSSIKEDFR